MTNIIDMHRGVIPPGPRDSDAWRNSPSKNVSEIVRDQCSFGDYFFIPRHYQDRAFLWGRAKPGRAIQLYHYLFAEEYKTFLSFEDSCLFFNSQQQSITHHTELPPHVYIELKNKYCKCFPGNLSICGATTDELIFYSHLGLGDQIVAIGLVHHVSDLFKKVYVPSKSQYYPMMKYCYQDHPKIEVVEVCKNSEYGGCSGGVQGVKHLEERTGLRSFHAGHSKLGSPWNFSFYKNNAYEYDLSFDKFYLPESEQENEDQFKHLMNLYKISGDYIVIGAEYSGGKFSLDVNSSLPAVHIKQSENLKSNMFFLKKTLIEAKEVHLVNSALFHLAERLPLKGELIYHDIRRRDFGFYYKDQKVINYNNK